jgi:hypothetical protein
VPGARPAVARAARSGQRGERASGSSNPAAGRDTMSDQVSEAVRERLEEGEAGRLRALVAAVCVGAAVTVLAYRLLRGGGAGGDDDGEDDEE